MNQDVERAGSYLATANVDFIAYASVGGSFYEGSGHDEEILGAITRVANVPAGTTALAVTDALRSLGARKISIATPYNQSLNEHLRLYYEATGLEVVNVEGDPRAAECGAREVNDLSPESILEFAPNVCDRSADALFCPCTAWRAAEVAAELERLTGRPVVTANQATIWAAFKALGITDHKPGFGSLLDSLASPKVQH
jgi:maleate cis-trans isomerase